MLEKDALLAKLDTLDAYSWQERCRGWRTHETCGESVYWVYMAVVDSSEASSLTLEELAEHIEKLPPMFLEKSNDQSQRWESSSENLTKTILKLLAKPNLRRAPRDWT